jgi:hypothetical protein
MVWESFIIPPRFEYCKCVDGYNWRVSNQPVAVDIQMQILPKNLHWINTRGAYYNPYRDVGAVSKVYRNEFPAGIVFDDPFMDGPYLSIEHMEACSPGYHLIISPNPIIAADILLKNVQRKRPVLYNTYFVPDFIRELQYILEHTFIGHNGKKGIKGIHFYTSDVKILRHVNSTYKSRVQFGIIEKVDPVTEQILSKKNASTFWPSQWGIEKCIIECAVAWSNKVKNNFNSNYTGHTSDGLKIAFCFRNGQLTTVYPDHSNNESD